ncbi:beta-galactosidase [Lacticaseibacillus mingshuiensis]|uniref:beta-galactosidase n=1 Tax=Lacticaseibacillus mingshuiensis TaxID=2799574 RepID=UPI00402B6073
MTQSKLLNVDHLLHGGDYNPDQWLNYPEILTRDIEMMKEANINTVSLGIFAWSALEPTEGNYQFDWLDEAFDRIEAIHGNVILATPSGAKPAWLAKKYPEVLRTNEYDQKLHYGERHNHCFTSPRYREAVQRLDKKLAERYGQRKSLILWHISNELGGECHCDLCQSAFRQWLRTRYQTLDALNNAWYTSFWSHHFDAWDEIHSPSPLGDTTLSGLNADWRRFVTAQTIDFFEGEKTAIRAASPTVPITTNFMADGPDLMPFHGLDYAEFAKHVDIVSWDCYPQWADPAVSDAQLGAKIGMINDYFRGLKQQNFLIMESTPSLVNWHPVNRAKRPGQHFLSSMQLLAHGSDSVLYFQIRQSRGAAEKFHGAVIAQDGSNNNRVFTEVSAVGDALTKLTGLIGVNRPRAKVALLYDQQNQWNLDDTQAYSQQSKQYWQTLQKHYTYFWQHDIPVDILPPDADLSTYLLVIDLMHYSLPIEQKTKLEAYVQDGGTLIGSYLSGLTDEIDLAYLGDSPLAKLYGIQRNEIDTLYPQQQNSLRFETRTYPVHDYAEVVRPTTAESIASFEQDFYAGHPALTVNKFGEGHAYYLAGRSTSDFLEAFYPPLLNKLKISGSQVISPLPTVSVQTRDSSEGPVSFIMNFSAAPVDIDLLQAGVDLLTGHQLTAGKQQLAGYGVIILQCVF